MSTECIAVQSQLTTRALLPFVLSVIGGSTDTIGFLGMNGLFTAHITGNLVVLAAHVVAGDSAVLSYILAVPAFVLVLLLTSLLANRLERRGFETLRPLLSLELLLLAAFFTISVSSPAQLNPNSALAVTMGMCGVGAMAVQTVLAQVSLAGTPSTAVMTTNVAQLVGAIVQAVNDPDLSARDRAHRRVSQVLPVIIGFTLGCALGAVGQARLGLWALSIPTGLALVALGLNLRPER